MDAARASFTRASELAPHDLHALSGLVGLDLATGRVKDAVTRIEAAMKRMEPTGTLLMLAAQTYDAAGDAAKTEELLRRAINAEPARLKAYEQLGRFYIRAKRLGEATSQFQQVVQRNPTSTSANTMLGMLFEAQRNLPQAEQQYQKVLAIDARAAVAANNLAWLYVASRRNLDQALELAKVAKQTLPDEPHVNDTLGWVYYQKNMASTAVQYLESSVRKDPSDPTTHYHLGMAYAQWGEKDKARQQLKQALASKVEFEGADEARKTLAQIGS
jgi:Flp pilus assembly protein TadD